MTPVWFRFDRQRDYEEVMLAWIEELTGSPTCFPHPGYDPSAFVPELIPVLDAWVMTKDAMALVTTHKGDWLGTTPGEVLLCHGDNALKMVNGAVGPLHIYHGCSAYGVGRPTPWRLFTKAPEVHTSPVAIRRQARVLAKWRVG